MYATNILCKHWFGSGRQEIGAKEISSLTNKNAAGKPIKGFVLLHWSLLHHFEVGFHYIKNGMETGQ